MDQPAIQSGPHHPKQSAPGAGTTVPTHRTNALYLVTSKSLAFPRSESSLDRFATSTGRPSKQVDPVAVGARGIGRGPHQDRGTNGRATGMVRMTTFLCTAQSTSRHVPVGDVGRSPATVVLSFRYRFFFPPFRGTCKGGTGAGSKNVMLFYFDHHNIELKKKKCIHKNSVSSVNYFNSMSSVNAVRHPPSVILLVPSSAGRPDAPSSMKRRARSGRSTLAPRRRPSWWNYEGLFYAPFGCFLPLKLGIIHSGHGGQTALLP